MKKLSVSVFALMIVLALTLNASACTSIYVGGSYTESGNPIFARSEDISNSMNKLMYVIPSGVHTAGEDYNGCGDFHYTFTHDSYGYTAFMDDNTLGVCPDCGGTHTHTPYQSGGTNEMGVSMSATESISANSAIRAVDPTNRANGIEEAEITTVILSEAATAREAVDLLLKIYAELGAAGGSGIYIGDQSEIWYIENTTGTQYIALKLNDDLCFLDPNMPTIGLIDLDDTEHVIASKDLIAKAVEADTFVGDADKNQINYLLSYGNGNINARMVEGSNYVNGNDALTADSITYEDFAITNVDAEGNIIPLTTKLVPYKLFTAQDIIGYYALGSIGSTGNLETHIFEIDPDMETKRAIVEWVSMDHDGYTLFVPYYPMMTDDVYAGLKVGTEKASSLQELPEGAFGYPTQITITVDGARTKVDGFKVLPEGWETSYYWCFDALSNYCVYTNPDASAEVKAGLAEVQAVINAKFVEMQASVMDGTATNESLTAASMELAELAHHTALSLLQEQLAK